MDDLKWRLGALLGALPEVGTQVDRLMKASLNLVVSLLVVYFSPNMFYRLDGSSAID